MKKFIIALFASGALVAGASGGDGVPLDELVEAIKKIHMQASAGDLKACNELWMAGKVIEKVEILKKAYPVEVRLERLKFAAEKGSADANFKLFEYFSCDKRKPFNETRKWLEVS